MEIKNIVKELCETKSNERIDYIVSYLRQNNISFNVLKYQNGKNIEINKTGKSNKCVIFMAHHDIYSNIIEGANDNTSSVAVLLSLCKFLYFYDASYMIKIVFNDKEELLGGILNKNISIDKFGMILNNTGSFQYLKNNIFKKNEILGIFILELSGIGDSLYFAKKSGNVECSSLLNKFLKKVADLNNYRYLEVPILNSDMISVRSLDFTGTVIGATPYIESLNNMNNEYPHIWEKIHTSRDNFFSIQESALNMVYNFLIKLIENLNILASISNSN